MSEIQNHYLTPTYQSLLISCIQTASIRLSTVNGNPADVWTALRVLYIIIPKECKEDVQKLYDHIQTGISQIGGIQRLDMYQQRTTVAHNTKIYLYHKNVEFFESLIKSLDERNYLEKRKKEIQSNTNASTQQLFG